MYRINHIVEDCIGCGACAAACDNWELTEINGEQKSRPKQTELDEVGCNQDAADSCPANCIKIVEE